MNPSLESFLSSYSEDVVARVMSMRDLLLKSLPDIQEQVDLSAKMIAYTYGQKYAELICVIIPSKSGVKLGFNRGVELADPQGLLEGKGKISRYVVIKSLEQVNMPAIKTLLVNALKLYKVRMDVKK